MGLLDQMRALTESGPATVRPTVTPAEGDGTVEVLDGAITTYFGDLLGALQAEYDEDEDVLWGFIAECAEACEGEGLLPTLPEGTPTDADREVLVEYLAALKRIDFAARVMATAAPEA